MARAKFNVDIRRYNNNNNDNNSNLLYFNSQHKLCTAFISSPEPLGSQGELIGWP